MPERTRQAGFTPAELPAVSRREGGAFTLVELLVVVAILALLISLLMPVLTRAKDLAKDTLCRTNLNAIQKAMDFYRRDNDDVIPVACIYNSGGTPNALEWKPYWETWNNFIAEYPGENRYGWRPKGGYTDPDTFICPSYEHEPGLRGTYGLNHRMSEEDQRYRDGYNWVKFIPATNTWHYLMGDSTLRPTKMYLSGDAEGPGPGHGQNYVFSYAANYRSADFRHLVTPGEPESGHVNIVFHDGHVEGTPRDEIYDQHWGWGKLPWWNRDEYRR